MRLVTYYFTWCVVNLDPAYGVVESVLVEMYKAADKLLISIAYLPQRDFHYLERTITTQWQNIRKLLCVTSVLNYLTLQNMLS